MGNSKNKPLFSVALVMGTCALLNVLAQVWIGGTLRKYISKSEEDGGLGAPKLSMLPMLGWSIVIGGFMITITFKYLPRVVAKANTYFFIARACYISISGLDAWYLAGPECIKDGPELSQKFVTTVMGTVESIMGGLGVAAFQAIMGDWCFRPCFWVTTALQSIGALWDCFIFLRWNTAIGLPDELCLLLGNAVIREIVAMMDFMPGVILTSKLCPAGAESTMYAILAGFANFGRAIGGNFGAIVVPLTGLKIRLGEGAVCDDSPLVLLTLIGQGIFPCVSIPFTWWLIPDARLTGTIIDENGNEFPPPEVEDDIEAVEPEYKEASDAYVPEVPAPVAPETAPVYDPYAQFQPAPQQYSHPSNPPATPAAS